MSSIIQTEYFISLWTQFFVISIAIGIGVVLGKLNLVKIPIIPYIKYKDDSKLKEKPRDVSTMCFILYYVR
jgi:hypothetical protein